MTQRSSKGPKSSYPHCKDHRNPPGGGSGKQDAKDDRSVKEQRSVKETLSSHHLPFSGECLVFLPHRETGVEMMVVVCGGGEDARGFTRSPALDGRNIFRRQKRREVEAVGSRGLSLAAAGGGARGEPQAASGRHPPPLGLGHPHYILAPSKFPPSVRSAVLTPSTAPRHPLLPGLSSETPGALHLPYIPSPST